MDNAIKGINSDGNDFDYRAFALDLKVQAKDLIPDDIFIYEWDNIVNIVESFALTAGEAISNDSSLNLTLEQQEMLVQIIAEWIFHKMIDLIRSGISDEYREPFLREIAFVIYEITKQCYAQKIPHEQLIDSVELGVVKKFYEELKKLYKKKIITEEIYKKAISQSNIDQMAQEKASQKQQETSKAILIGIISLIFLIVGLSAIYIKITKRVDKIKNNQKIEHTLKTDSSIATESSTDSSASSSSGLIDKIQLEKVNTRIK